MTPIEYLTIFSDSIIYLSTLFIPFYLWGNDRKKLILYILCLTFTLMVVYFLKIGLAFPRPSFALVPIPPTSSFPSMHASLGLLPAGFFFHLKKYRITLAAYGILIAYSRVLLGVHYWPDILAGALLGFAIPLIIFRYQKQIYRFIQFK
ncbi:MAG: phosphatase PAP2 family protein [archaeon]|nr:MAG: phosphatase PAP2 family protein [archaeon]